MTQPIHPMLFTMADAMLEAIRKEHVYVNCVDGDPAHTIIDGGTFDFTLVARAAVQALMEHRGLLTQWADEQIAFRELLEPLVEGEGRQPVPGVYRDGQGEG